MEFCKQFNDRTKTILPETPVPVSLFVKPDRTFSFVTRTPPSSHFIKKVASIAKGSQQPGKEPSGKITLAQLYEIAKVKQTDAALAHLSLEQICKSLLGTARSMGVEVVKSI